MNNTLQKSISDILSLWNNISTNAEKNGNKLYLVNAGTMNHGKSSFFNCLLNKEVFKTGDRRITEQCKEVEYRKDVFLVDTPGFDATQNDDKEAFSAYKKASCIFMVHNIENSKLHKSELDRINQMKYLFPSERYFGDHFCLVISYKDN